MVEELDAGPVYLKKPFPLEGNAQEIFERMSSEIYQLIREIVANEPVPVEQQGESVVFSRRTPSQSALPSKGSIAKLFDHIRMLDADSYPRAFLDHGEFRLTFRDPILLAEDRLEARMEVVQRD